LRTSAGRGSFSSPGNSTNARIIRVTSFAELAPLFSSDQRAQLADRLPHRSPRPR
jgi:hypothetical protein